MARYFKSQVETPISTAYSPYVMKYIDDSGQALQTNTDLLNAGLTDAQKLLNLQGGYRTQQRAKDLAQVYSDEINQLNDEIYKNGNITGGIQKINNLKNRINSDPEVQDIKADEAYKTEVDKLMSQSGFKEYGLQDFYIGKGFIQSKKGERFNPYNFYHVDMPGNTNAEYKDLFAQIKPVISRIYSSPVTKEWKDENGVVHTQEVQEGEEAETLRRDHVRDEIAKYIYSDPENSLNKPSRIYAQNRFNRNNPENSFTIDDHIDDITNAFLGDFETKKEIQRVLGDKTSKRSGRNGPGALNSDDNETISEIGNVLNNINDRGKSSAVVSTIAAINNGVDNKDGTYTKNVSGSQPIVKTSFDKDNYKYNEKLNAFLPYKADIENFKKSKIEELKNLKGSENATGHIIGDKSYYLDPKGMVHEQELINDQWKTKKIISIDDYIKLFPEYQIEKKYALDNGIDIEDIELNKELFKKTPEQIEAMNNFNAVLSMLEGQWVFTPDSNDGITVDSGGHLVTKDNLTFSQEEAEDKFGEHWWNNNLETLEGLKLIKKYKKSIKLSDGTSETKTFYNVPVYNISNNDIVNMTKSAEINRWGSEKFTEDQLIPKINTNISKLESLKLKALKQETLDRYNEDKNVTKDIGELEEKLNEKNFKKEDLDQILPYFNDIKNRSIKTEEDKKKRNEDLFNLHLRIFEPDKYNILYQQDVGKSHPQTTDSNPLGMQQ